ncbi:DDE superfamily endonuclease [Streptomyces sp. MnatMP-M27]|nr:DDE superfamily endonuclease [Streptomyces sp. MnatMP-M27]
MRVEAAVPHQVAIDAATRLVVAVGRPVTGNRNVCKAWEPSGAKAALGRAIVIADGGDRGTGLLIPHCRARGQTELSAWKREHNTSHRKVRARVEHAFARMKAWKILRDCRLRGDGLHTAMLGIARLHNLALTGNSRPARGPERPRGGGSLPTRLGECSVDTEFVAFDIQHWDA